MARKVWIVGAGDGVTVADIVARAGGDARAVADGRVFVGKKRANRDGDPVRVGDRVTISSELERGVGVTVLHDGDGVVVIDKPAGTSTIADQASAAGSAQALAARAVGRDVSALHPTSRLDRDVSGVVTFAVSKRAAADLAVARERGAYARRYVAIAARAPSPPVGEWNASIGRAKDPKLRAAFESNETRFEAKAALTRYRVVAVAHRDDALLAVTPITGRTHQIRVHASHAGAPLLGDRAYGGPPRVILASGKILSLDRIYLHCARVVLQIGRKKLDLRAPIPHALTSTWAALGGEPEAWDTALACDSFPSSA